MILGHEFTPTIKLHSTSASVHDEPSIDRLSCSLREKKPRATCGTCSLQASIRLYLPAQDFPGPSTLQGAASQDLPPGPPI